MELIPNGLFDGVMTMFGEYEECLSIESPGVDWNSIRGKYCMAKIPLPFLNPAYPESDENPSENPLELPYSKKKALIEGFGRDFDELNNKLKLLQMINLFHGSHFRVGLCIPSTCEAAELERALNKCKCATIQV